MGQVIPMPGDPHQQIQALLPWYMNGTLDAGEVAAVEAHIAECAECRQDLAFERGINRDVADVPLDVEQGWAAMRDRIQRQAAASPAVHEMSRRSLWRRPIPLGWALTAQAAAVLIVAGGAHRVLAPNHSPEPVYHALGSAPQRISGNMVVIFRPDTVEKDLREAVVASNAELVGGPTASDAYVLRVVSAGRDAALRRLRANSHVVLAEPIDGGDRR